jgi:hypothetical protein
MKIKNITLILELTSVYLNGKECVKLLILNKNIRSFVRMYPTLH